MTNSLTCLVFAKTVGIKTLFEPSKLGFKVHMDFKVRLELYYACLALGLISVAQPENSWVSRRPSHTILIDL